MTTVNKRITYSYFDHTDGRLESHIDVDLNIDDTDDPSPSQVQKWVASKWKKVNYTNGEIDSVQILTIE